LIYPDSLSNGGDLLRKFDGGVFGGMFFSLLFLFSFYAFDDVDVDASLFCMLATKENRSWCDC